MAYKHLGRPLHEPVLDEEPASERAPVLPIQTSEPPSLADAVGPAQEQEQVDVFLAEDGTWVVELQPPTTSVAEETAPAASCPPDADNAVALAEEAARAERALAELEQLRAAPLLRRSMAQVAMYAHVCAPATPPRGLLVDKKV